MDHHICIKICAAYTKEKGGLPLGLEPPSCLHTCAHLGLGQCPPVHLRAHYWALLLSRRVEPGPDFFISFGLGFLLDFFSSVWTLFRGRIQNIFSTESTFMSPALQLPFTMVNKSDNLPRFPFSQVSF